MRDKLRDLIELRNAIAEATDQAFDCDEEQAAQSLVSVEIMVARRIASLARATNLNGS